MNVIPDLVSSERGGKYLTALMEAAVELRCRGHEGIMCARVQRDVHESVRLHMLDLGVWPAQPALGPSQGFTVSGLQVMIGPPHCTPWVWPEFDEGAGLSP